MLWRTNPDMLRLLLVFLTLICSFKAEDLSLESLQEKLHQNPSADMYADLLRVTYTQARIQQDLSLYEQAFAVSRQAITSYPEDIRFCEWTAKLQNTLHFFNDSIRTWEECYKKSPNPEYMGQIAEVHMHQMNYPKALKYIKQAEKSQAHAQHTRWALFYFGIKEYEASLRSWDKALESYIGMDPEPPAWCLIQIGDVFAAQGRRDEARANYRKALQYVPKYALAFARIRALDLPPSQRATSPQSLYEALPDSMKEE